MWFLQLHFCSECSKLSDAIGQTEAREPSHLEGGAFILENDLNVGLQIYRHRIDNIFFSVWEQ